MKYVHICIYGLELYCKYFWASICYLTNSGIKTARSADILDEIYLIEIESAKNTSMEKESIGALGKNKALRETWE